jgi:hypothetical protein
MTSYAFQLSRCGPNTFGFQASSFLWRTSGMQSVIGVIKLQSLKEEGFWAEQNDSL